MVSNLNGGNDRSGLVIKRRLPDKTSDCIVFSSVTILRGTKEVPDVVGVVDDVVGQRFGMISQILDEQEIHILLDLIHLFNKILYPPAI